MRHRIKAGKVGSYTDSEFTNDDEALAAMEFYDSPDAME